MDESVQEHFTELDEASRLLLEAADVIERQGWCQNYIGTAGGQVCLEGALNVACGRGPERILERHPLTDAALRRVKTSLGCPAFLWNDAPGRTKEEVVAKLRAVALGG